MKLSIPWSIFSRNRNWHYTINRRLRAKGWDLRRWPSDLGLFGFIPELVDLQNQMSPFDSTDFSDFLNGAAYLVNSGGAIQSQLGQECLVASKTQHVKNPFFLEIGGFHPYLYSNTATLRDSLGWKGVSLDPSQKAKEDFHSAGLEEYFRNQGVGAITETVYFVEDGAFSRTSKDKVSGAYEIEIVGIEDLVYSLPDITYLSIDIEGGEYQIIKNFPWSISRPMVVTVEFNDRQQEKQEIIKVMTSQGYRVVLSSLSAFEVWFVQVN